MSAYLDNAASTRVHPDVLRVMCPMFSEHFGNPSSPHLAAANARDSVENARDVLARAINAVGDEIVFTSGGTEANHLAIIGAASMAPPERRHLVVSAIEHSSVLSAIDHLRQVGFSVTVVPPGRNGIVAVDAVAAAVRQNTFLVSVMMVNNEIGSIQPIAQINAFLRPRGILFHSDAVQAVGKIPVDVRNLGVDLLSMSAHKIHGPKGIGALFLRRGVRLRALIGGGGQERGLRSGTENVPAIVGFAKAIEMAIATLEVNSARAQALITRFESAVLSKVAGAAPAIAHHMRSPYISNILFADVDNNYLLRSLDSLGIYVTSGSACASHSLEPSHVLLAIGLSENQARSAIRFSLSNFTTEEEIDYTVHHLVQVINPLTVPQIAREIP